MSILLVAVEPPPASASVVLKGTHATGYAGTAADAGSAATSCPDQSDIDNDFPTGSGDRWTLHWSLDPLAGQRATFVERGAVGAKPIVTTNRSSGQVSFTPNPAAGSATRTIEARVVQAGLPRGTLTVARYRVSTRLRAVRGLKRSKRRLSWHSQTAASAYTAVIDNRNGTVVTRTVKRPLVSIPARLGGRRVRVTIYPLDAFQLSGPGLSKVL